MESASVLQSITNLLSFLIFFGVIIWLVVYWFNGRDKGFIAFAAKHGLTFESNGRTGYTGILRGIMSYKTYGTDTVSGKNIALFHLTHTEGSGKNKRTYARTVAAISLKGTQSHVFVNSKLNDMQEQSGLDTSQRYTAEGDFGKYFDIYFPGGQQIPALSLFAPDMMQVVLANYGYYDIEIDNNVLYIYEYSHLRKFEQLEPFYQLAVSLGSAIDDNSPRKLNLAGGSANTGTAARLQKQKLGVVGTIASILIVALVVAIQVGVKMGGEAAGFASVLMMISIVVILGLVIVKLVQNQLLQNSYRKRRAMYLPPNTSDKK